MEKTIALITNLTEEQASQFVAVMDAPDCCQELLETLPKETARAFVQILETALEERRGAAVC